MVVDGKSRAVGNEESFFVKKTSSLTIYLVFFGMEFCTDLFYVQHAAVLLFFATDFIGPCPGCLFEVKGRRFFSSGYLLLPGLCKKV